MPDTPRDWTTIKTRFYGRRPVRVSRIGSWAMYPRGPQAWRGGRSLVNVRFGTWILHLG
jgi:hypothetical protein